MKNITKTYQVFTMDKRMVLESSVPAEIKEFISDTKTNLNIDVVYFCSDDLLNGTKKPFELARERFITNRTQPYHHARFHSLSPTLKEFLRYLEKDDKGIMKTYDEWLKDKRSN